MMKYAKRWKICLCALICVMSVCGCEVLKPKVYTYTTTTTRKETINVPKKVVTYEFVDDYQNQYEANANPNVPQCSYQKAAFLLEGDKMRYGQEEYGYRLGVDVSYYQAEIEWGKVKEDGIDFAMIRLGYRGYDDGKLHLDEKFKTHIEGANAAGMDVGVYFFTQAVNENEAKEEAKYVISKLEEYHLQMPVAYDVEAIDEAVGRMDSVPLEQLTKNAKVFSETIEEAGYDSMIYCNMFYEAYKLDLEQLKGYPVWYADYNRYPQTPYHFEIWQYTDKGNVDGIEGYVDLNIQMLDKK